MSGLVSRLRRTSSSLDLTRNFSSFPVSHSFPYYPLSLASTSNSLLLSDLLFVVSTSRSRLGPTPSPKRFLPRFQGRVVVGGPTDGRGIPSSVAPVLLVFGLFCCVSPPGLDSSDPVFKAEGRDFPSDGSTGDTGHAMGQGVDGSPTRRRRVTRGKRSLDGRCLPPVEWTR